MNWKGKGRCLKPLLVAALLVVLGGCAQYASLTSRIPMVRLQMDSRYINGTNYDRALMLYEKGFLVEAREKARAVTKKEDDYSRARRLIFAINTVIVQLSEKHRELGENYYKAGIYGKALSEYRLSLRYDPDDAMAKSRVISISKLVNDGVPPDIEKVALAKKKEEAKKDADAGQAGTPSPTKDENPLSTANVHYMNGKIYLDAKDYAKAAREFSLTLKYVPSFMDAEDLLAVSEKNRDKEVERHLAKGISYFQAEEMDLAIKEWDIVLQHDPDNKTAKDYKQRAESILERLESIRKHQAVPTY